MGFADYARSNDCRRARNSSRTNPCSGFLLMQCLMGGSSMMSIHAFSTSVNKGLGHARAPAKSLSLSMVCLDTTVASSQELDEISGRKDFPVDSTGSLDHDDNPQEALRHRYPKQVEVIKDLEPIVDEMVDTMLLETGDKAWQPQDFLPDLSQENWMEEVKSFRDQSSHISDDLLVVLIGDMVTEEALPTYQTLLNSFEGCDDPTGTSPSAWARWSRGWTSEENRHGDLLNKYLYLTGRCDMRSVEVTIQHLITNGFNPQADQSPYKGFLYTSFQERATKISHGNVGRLAKSMGDSNLARICAKIAGDEGRHEKAYQTFCREILQRDPDALLQAFGELIRGQINMPAQQMTDGVDPLLYDHFSTVAQSLGVYTALDYAQILKHLVKDAWDLEHLEGLSSAAEKECDYLCRLPERYLKLAERSLNREEARKRKNGEIDSPDPVAFRWIYGRSI